MKAPNLPDRSDTSKRGRLRGPEVRRVSASEAQPDPAERRRGVPSEVPDPAAQTRRSDPARRHRSGQELVNGFCV